MNKFKASPEKAYTRDVRFAIELLDAVTLERVSRGVTVTADGLLRKPIVNASGLFVWLDEDLAPLQKITIDPDTLPYEKAEINAADLKIPLTTIELKPRPGYPFEAGVTGIRGTLAEERVTPKQPVANAGMHLRWLDDSGAWRDATTISRSDENGDFAAILRFAPDEIPLLDNQGAMTVRLRVRRDSDERGTADLKLAQGRIADALIFYWDELQP